jgi:hypothetical protein
VREANSISFKRSKHVLNDINIWYSVLNSEENIQIKQLDFGLLVTRNGYLLTYVYYLKTASV